MIDYALYGRRLKEAREAKGWTVEDVAKSFQTALYWIEALEDGDDTRQINRWLSYAELLGIHPSDLFRDEGTMTLSEIQVKLGGSPEIIDVVGMVRESRDDDDRAETDHDRDEREVGEAVTKALKAKVRRTGVIKWDGEPDREAEYRRLRNECAKDLWLSADLGLTLSRAFDEADAFVAELKRRDGNGCDVCGEPSEAELCSECDDDWETYGDLDGLEREDE